MLGDVTLHEDGGDLGVEPDGEEDGRQLGGRGTHDIWLRGHGERVEVDDSVEDVLVVLPIDPVAQRPEEIAEMHGAGRLNAREHTGHSARLPRRGRVAYPRPMGRIR